MTVIKKLICNVNEELEGAKDYAEKYLECKVKGETQWAQRYKEMANDELKHAGYLHDKLSHDIEELGKVYTPPVEMSDKWEHSHKEYVEQVAWIKQMLAM